MKSKLHFILLLFLGINFFYTQCNEPNTYTYQTKTDGAWSSPSTWLGGIAPPNNLGNGNSVLITHTVSNNHDLKPNTNSILTVKNGGILTLNKIQTDNPGATIILNGGKINLTNGDFQITTSTSSVCAINSCIYIANGNFQFELSGTNMHFQSTGIDVKNGNIQSKANVTGNAIKIWTNSNLEKNGGTWAGNSISAYYAGGGVTGFSGLPAESSSSLDVCLGTIINAVNDSQLIGAGTLGTVSVLNNDTLNGSPATLSNINLTQVSTTNPGVILNPATGLVSVATGTAVGNYTIVYQICDKANPSVCRTATVLVTVSCDPVVWYHTSSNELFNVNINTGVSTLVCSDFRISAANQVLDIGFAPDKTTLYAAVGGRNALYRFDIATCTFELLTNVGSIATPSNFNALSFLPDGTALIGGSVNNKIYRANISGNTYTLSEWITISDNGIVGSTGDFILLGDKLYAAMYNATHQWIYEINVTPFTYTPGAISGKYSIATATSSSMFGMAAIFGRLYGGFQNRTLKEITLSGTNISLSANLLSGLSTGSNGIYGATTQLEGLGQADPIISAVGGVITSGGGIEICTNTDTAILTSSVEFGNQWYKDGVAIPGATGKTITVTQAGSYSVQVTYSGGCLSSMSPAIVVTIKVCVCYENPALVVAQNYPVKHGITVLRRAGKVSTETTNTSSDWPMNKNSAYTVLESKTKGFVITRNANPEATITAPVIGMMVFDTDENSGKGCLKIYTGSASYEGWKCFTNQTCP